MGVVALKFDPSLTLDSIPKGQRIIVCGGRDFYDRAKVFHVLDAVRPREIAHGNAKGADSLADDWALSRGVHCERFPAWWRPLNPITGERKLDRGAGPKRNRRMFAAFRPDGIVAFPGGNGTADMCEVGEKAGVWVVRIG